MFLPNMASGVYLHSFHHSLLNQRFHARELVAIRGPEVVCQIHTNHDTGGGWVDTHGVRHLTEGQ